MYNACAATSFIEIIASCQITRTTRPSNYLPADSTAATQIRHNISPWPASEYPTLSRHQGSLSSFWAIRSLMLSLQWSRSTHNLQSCLNNSSTPKIMSSALQHQPTSDTSAPSHEPLPPLPRDLGEPSSATLKTRHPVSQITTLMVSLNHQQTHLAACFSFPGSRANGRFRVD